MNKDLFRLDEKCNLTVYVPCPVGSSGYAGWFFQIKKIFTRLGAGVQFKFVFRESSSMKKWIGPIDFPYVLNCVSRVLLFSSNRRLIFFPQFFSDNAFVALFFWALRVPYVVRVSGGELDKGSFAAYCLRLFLMRRARAVILLNMDGVERAKRLAIKPHRLHYIPNPVDNDFRPPSLLERFDARNFLAIKDELAVVGIVGTICRRKRQLDLIHALKNLNRTDVTVVLCGPSKGHPEADLEYKEQCVREADAAGIPCIHIDFTDDVRLVLWALDIFVMTSEREGMPNALLEAMACGLPCIGADIPGVRDVIEDKLTGFLYPAADVMSLSVHLQALLSNSNKDIGRMASSSIKRDFSPSVIDQKYMALLVSYK